MEFCAANGRLQPGFRFHPTDEELIMYYLKRKVLGKRLEPGVITEVDIYKFHPQDLRELASMKRDLNWYFFCPKEKKYQSGIRANRSTDSGYWKATGNDRVVSYQRRSVGKIKTLVFHLGKPPKGERTDWVMHEYRLEDSNLAEKCILQDSYVLCKVFKKSGWGPKAGEQYGAPFIEEEWDDADGICDCAQTVQNHAICAVPSDACSGLTAEQGYPGAVLGAAVNQLPSPISVAAASANLASSSSKGPMPMAEADPVVQASLPMGLMPDLDDDEIDRMLDLFTADDDPGDIFGGLPELDESLIWTDRSSLANFDGGGLGLPDLDGPM